MKYNFHGLVLCLFFAGMCTKPPPTTRQGLILPGNALVTSNGYAKVQRWRPDGLLDKLIREEEPQAASFLLPDQTGFFIRTSEHITLVDGAERYAAVTLAAPNIVTMVMPTMGNILTLNRQGLIQKWQYNQISADPPVQLMLPAKSPPLAGAAFSQAGTQVVTWGEGESLIRVWDATNGTSLFVLTLQDHPSVATWSRDGNFLFVGSLDGQGKMIRSGRTFPTLSGSLTGQENGIRSASLSPDGTTLLTGDGMGTVQAWGFDSRFGFHQKMLFSDREGPIESISWSNDNQALITVGEDGNAHLWQTSIGALGETERWIYPQGKLTDLKGDFFQMAMSFDSTLVASYNEDDRIRVFKTTDIQAGNVPSATYDKPSDGVYYFNVDAMPVQSLGWFPTNNRMISGHTNGKVRIWRLMPPPGGTYLGTGVVEKEWQAHTQAVLATLYLSASNVLVTASTDGSILLWQAAAPYAQKGTIPVTASILSIAASPAGDRLAVVTQDHTVTLWDVQNPDALQQISVISDPNQDFRVVALGSDRRYVFVGTADGQDQVWDLQNPKHPVLQHSWLAHTFYSYRNQGAPATVRSMTLCGGEGFLLSGGPSGDVKTWDWKTGKLVSTAINNWGEVRSLVCTPSGESFAYSSGRTMVSGQVSSVQLQTQFQIDP